MYKNMNEAIEDADMPVFKNGVWVDEETGLEICVSAPKKAKKTLSVHALDARSRAKLLGAKALKGTPKQKEWAEKIRAEKLAEMHLEEAQKLCGSSAVLSSASFWINNRSKKFTFDDAVETMQQLRALNEKHYDTLARTCSVAAKDAARKEIISFYKSCKVVLDGEFPTLTLQKILESI